MEQWHHACHEKSALTRSIHSSAIITTRFSDLKLEYNKKRHEASTGNEKEGTALTKTFQIVLFERFIYVRRKENEK